MPQGKITKRKLSQSDVSSSENNDRSDDDEFLPPGKSSKGAVKKPKRAAVKKSKQIQSNACDSDDEILVKSLQKRSPTKKSLQNNVNSSWADDGKFMHQTTGNSTKEAIKKKRAKMSKKMVSDATDSEDEPLVKISQTKSPATKSVQNKSSNEDKYESLAKVNGFSKKSGHEQENDSMSCSSAETERLLLNRLKFKEKNERSNVSSDEDGPITNLVEPKLEEMSENEHIVSSCSEDEPLATKSKMDASYSSKKSNRSSVSTDKEDSDDDVSMQEKMSEEDADKAETISICTISSGDVTLDKSSSKQSKSNENEDHTLKKGLDRLNDEDEVIGKITASKSQGNPRKISEQTSSSDDELVTSKKVPSSQKKRKSRKLIQSEESRYDESVNEEEPMSKTAETPRSKKSPKVSIQSSDSEDELLACKKLSIEQSRVNKEDKSRLAVNESNVSSDDDEPIAKLVESKLEELSENAPMSSDDPSDEEFTIKNKKKTSKKSPSSQKVPKKKSKPTDEDSIVSSDEDEPIAKLVEPKLKEKSKNALVSSDDSSDEEFTIKNKKKTPLKSLSSQTAPKKKSKPIEEESNVSSDDDEPIAKLVEPKLEKMSENSLMSSEDTSDEEFTIQNKKKTSKKSPSGQKVPKKQLKPTEGESNVSSDDDKPIAKLVESKLEEMSENSPMSSEDASDEEFTIKNKKKTSKKSASRQKVPKKQSKPTEEDHVTSSDEDKPLTKIAVINRKTKRTLISSDDASNDDFTIKSKKKNPKKSRSSQKAPKKNSKTVEDDGSSSSDNENEPLSKVAEKSKTKGSTKKNSSNSRIEHIKKYLRVSGIRIQSYDVLFKDCKSIKSKVEKLLNILQEKGLKGKPTLQKCKKLKKKLETKQEIAELDTANIIETGGRPKRGGAASVSKNLPNSPALKKFSRLKDIIDSEESD